MNRRMHIVVRARDRLAAIPASVAAETMRPLRVEPATGAPAFVIGLAVVRGAPVPVVDLGALLGAEGARETTRFVTVRSGDRVIALAVEAVVGTRLLAPGDVGPLPPLATAADGGAVALVGTLDRNLLVVLEAAKLVPPELWDRLAGTEGVR